jgi:predicted AAA+ superfamily ATPase
MYTRRAPFTPDGPSVFLFGARGTGKSTWVRSALPDALHVDLLDERSLFELTTQPTRLEAMADGAGKTTVVIDEVQKAPSLLDEVHRLIERRGFRFVLTGSSARKLRRSGVNLLAGRARTARMHPLTAAELGDSFSLAHSMRYGQLPTVYVAPDPGPYLASYVGAYLREEVRQEALVRNLPAFARFLEAASFSQASLLSVSDVARECGLPRKSVESHFELVEDLLIGVRLEPFQRRAKRATVQHPKFYYFDAGVYRSLRPRGPLDSEAEIDGAALETLVMQELRATNDTHGFEYSLHFWRTQSGVEVDFILYGPRGFLAIEVKRSSRFRDDDLRGLRAFCEEYPEARGVLLYLGDTPYRFGELHVEPLARFLAALPEWLASGFAAPS